MIPSAFLSVYFEWQLDCGESKSPDIIWGNPNTPPPLQACFISPLNYCHTSKMCDVTAQLSLIVPSFAQAWLITLFLKCLQSSVKPQNEEIGTVLLFCFSLMRAKRERSSESPTSHAHESMSRGFQCSYLNIAQSSPMQCVGSNQHVYVCFLF